MNDHTHVLVPAALPRLGQRISLRILHMLGWRVRYQPLPGPHGVAIVYPHTSNWDVFIGLFARWAIGMPFRWLAKEALFKGLAGKTIGPVFRRWGAVAVERRASTGATQRLAEIMHAHEWFWVALAPEGTRSYRPNWRSGFYHLAVAAKVPLLVVYMDFPNKEVGQRTCLATQVESSALLELRDADGESGRTLRFPSAPGGAAMELAVDVPVGRDYALVIEALSADTPTRFLGSSCNYLREVNAGRNAALVAAPIELTLQDCNPVFSR